LEAMRPTEAVVDLSKVAHNVETLAASIAPAELCAVVKADGYGHGAVAVARTAMASGASSLAVALVEEGIELREHGVEAPILVLSEPRPKEMVEVVAHDLVPSVYTGAGLAAAAAAAETNRGGPLDVQLLMDTGMRRVGASPDETLRLADAIAKKPYLRLDGVWTHCAVADEPDAAATDEQLDLFEAGLAKLEEAGHTGFKVHAGNSAVALGHRRGHFDMVRCGIATYGIAPSPALANALDLRPAMAVTSEVSFVKRVQPGDRISYGHRHEFERATVVATIPIGYADGVRRSYWRLGGEVLIRNQPRRIVGTVTMDQIMVDCGPDSDVAVGDPVVVMGAQDTERISAENIAEKLGTIPYEVVCDVGRRVRRRYL